MVWVCCGHCDVLAMLVIRMLAPKSPDSMPNKGWLMFGNPNMIHPKAPARRNRASDAIHFSFFCAMINQLITAISKYGVSGVRIFANAISRMILRGNNTTPHKSVPILPIIVHSTA